MNKRLLQFCVILLLALLYVGCDPVGMSQMNLLGDLLNSDVGPTLSAEQLLDSIESLNHRKKGFSIHFPVTDENASPKDGGIYVNPATGSKMVFSMFTDDADFSIGTVAIEQNTEGEISFGNGTLTPKFTKYVQSRGKGVYALYYMSESSDSLTRRIWSRVLLYVYPGADSIMTTRGYEDSKHIFYANH